MSSPPQDDWEGPPVADNVEWQLFYWCDQTNLFNIMIKVMHPSKHAPVAEREESYDIDFDYRFDDWMAYNCPIGHKTKVSHISRHFMYSIPANEAMLVKLFYDVPSDV